MPATSLTRLSSSRYDDVCFELGNNNDFVAADKVYFRLGADK